MSPTRATVSVSVVAPSGIVSDNKVIKSGNIICLFISSICLKCKDTYFSPLILMWLRSGLKVVCILYLYSILLYGYYKLFCSPIVITFVDILNKL